MNQYIQVKWKHTFRNEPILISIELNDARWELRKVEVFPDGHLGYASNTESFGGTRLGKEPLPMLADIARDPQFEPNIISQDEFERIWNDRKEARK